MTLRPLDPAARAARLFRIGDEIRPVGESDWLRIVEIHDMHNSRRLILEPYREFYAEPKFRVEHRRNSAEEA